MVRKGFWKMSSILLAALGLALVLVFTGCGDDMGTTLNLSGPVYNENWAEDAFAPTYTRFTGNRTVTSDPPGGTGSIVNGQLTFTFGVPATEYLETVTSLFGDYFDLFDDFSVTPAAAWEPPYG
jgi:hypothetical protein